jgi:hypothetical protein
MGNCSSSIQVVNDDRIFNVDERKSSQHIPYHHYSYGINDTDQGSIFYRIRLV